MKYIVEWHGRSGTVVVDAPSEEQAIIAAKNVNITLTSNPEEPPVQSWEAPFAPADEPATKFNVTVVVGV